MLLDGYIRVSTDEQALEGISLAYQRSRIEGYTELYGRDKETPFELREVVIDAGESGKTLDRPGLQGILTRMQEGVIGGMIVAKLDRLTRSLADWSLLIDRHFGEKRGKKLISVDNQVNTMTANGRLMLNLIVMIAQWERETIAERTREALQHKIKRGERCGKVRFGYRLGQDGKSLVDEPSEQLVIAKMRELDAGGLSLRKICRALEEMGIETKEGNRVWDPSTVSKILVRA